jgi:hypothetical protein
VRVRDTIVGIEMVRKLPPNIVASILPGSSLLRLLRHPSRYVRDAALPLVRRSLRDESEDVVHDLIYGPQETRSNAGAEQPPIDRSNVGASR